MTAKEKKTGLDVDSCAAAYDELLKNDWHLKMEEEAKERFFQEKRAAKRKKKAKEEAEAKKAKKHSRRKKRRVSSCFVRIGRARRV